MTPDNANEQSDSSGIIEIVSNIVSADTSGVIEIEQYDVADVAAQATFVEQHNAEGIIEIEQYDLAESIVVVSEPESSMGVVEVMQYDVPEPEMSVQQQSPTADATRSVTGSLNKGSVVASNSPAAINIAVKPVSETKNEASVMAERTTNNTEANDNSNFKDWMIMPEAAWPPPIFMKKNVSAKERFYLEYRWNNQWSYYDREASKNKDKYYTFQYIVVIGSLIIPALISLNSTVARFITDIIGGTSDTETIFRIGGDVVTVIISLAVAGSAAIESLKKYGENWNSYRSAAEELQAEKNFYDMSAGPYANNANPFATFVERVEGIVANQNGKYFQAVQQQIAKQAEENEEIVASFKAGDDDDNEFQLSVARQPVETPVVETVIDTVSDVVDTATEIVSDPEPEI